MWRGNVKNIRWRKKYLYDKNKQETLQDRLLLCNSMTIPNNCWYKTIHNIT